MYMSLEALYSLGFLSGISKVHEGREECSLRRSSYDTLKYVFKHLEDYGLHENLVSGISRSSTCAGIKWRQSELDLYLESVELDKINHSYFAMGCFDAGFIHSGCYSSERPHLKLETTESLEPILVKFIEDNLGAKAEGNEYFGVDALDVMGDTYRYDKDMGYSKAFTALSNWKTQIDGITNSTRPRFFFSTTRADAVPPFKARLSDSGFDLTLLEKTRSIGNIEMYSTGIKAYPAYGWYFMLVPRSSIIKSGYMLANNCGIIDRSYTGEILVPLVKVDENAPDLEMPCRLVQLIPQPIIDFEFQETDDDIDSARGTKGFGSSGK